MEKVTVNKDLCIKCGMCVSMCSENFSFDKDGKSDVINETVTENTKNHSIGQVFHNVPETFMRRK